MRITLEEVMEGIYAAAEQNCSLYVGSDWDGGWRVRIGGAQHTQYLDQKDVGSLREAAEWLHEQALIHFPEYAQRLGVKVSLGGPRGPTPSSAS